MPTKQPGLALVFAVFATAVYSQPLPQASPESAGMSTERLGYLTAAIEREVADGNMPGAVVAVARRGQLVYFESFGYLDKAAGIEMPKDAIFSIASMTKPVFAATAMALFERGELLLNEPIEYYLPELADLEVGVDGAVDRTVPAMRQRMAPSHTGTSMAIGRRVAANKQDIGNANFSRIGVVGCRRRRGERKSVEVPCAIPLV